MNSGSQYTHEEVLRWVQEIGQKSFSLPPEKLSLDASLSNDLDLDSIDMFDLLVLLEEKAGTSLPGDRLKDVTTVSQLVETLLEILNGSDKSGTETRP